MVEKVEAWRTSDGKLWSLDMEGVAFMHEEILNSKKNAQQLFEENKSDIDERVNSNMEYYLGYVDEDEFFGDDEDFEDYDEEKVKSQIYAFVNEEWECESEENKVGYCVTVNVDPERSCIYCGEPDERK
jgi:hypothetical protein